MSQIARRFTTLVGVALVMALAAALPAQAAPADTRTPDAILGGIDREPTPASGTRDTRTPDAILSESVPQPSPSSSTSSSDDFEWGYLAIGGSALLLVVGVGAVALRRRRPSVAIR